jgi:hypothetical protein
MANANNVLKIEFLDAGKEVDDRDIVSFLSSKNISIPQSYRDFLKYQNGGLLPGIKIMKYKLKRLYSYDQNYYFGNECIDTRDDEVIPENFQPFLIIGEFYSSSYLGISCNKDSFGKICIFANRDFEWEVIADDFLEFTTLLMNYSANDYNMEYSSSLHRAVQTDDRKSIVRHLQLQGDPNLIDEKVDSCNSLLMTAVAHGRLEIARILIFFGADVNLQDKLEFTALKYAMVSDFESLDAVKLLYKHYADFGITPKDSKHLTAAMYASMFNRSFRGLDWLIRNDIGLNIGAVQYSDILATLSHHPHDFHSRASENRILMLNELIKNASN